MLLPKRRFARVNVRLLAAFAIIVVVLVAGAYVGRKVRRHMQQEAALAQGNAAYERADWPAAVSMLGRWAIAHPEDAQALAKYGRALLALRPLPSDAVSRAVGVYRRLFELDPRDRAVFRRLVLLYETVGEFGELGYVTRRRLEVLPDDPAALLAQAKVLLYRQKTDEACAALTALVDKLSSAEPRPPEVVEACAILSDLAAQADPAGGEPARERETRQWADDAVRYGPASALALVQRAAVPRLLAQRARRAVSAADQQAGAADLTAAEQLQLTDPRVRLMLAEEWLAQRAFDQAAAQLDAAARVDPELLADYVVDPSDWVLARFKVAAALTLLEGAGEDGVRLARETLDQLQDRSQRVEVLPIAVELFLAGGLPADAREQLNAYIAATGSLSDTPQRAEQVAYLQAAIARAENKPYEVIERLEPLAGRVGAPSVMHTLLAEAYALTGQTGRMGAALARDPDRSKPSPDLAKTLARSYLEQGVWDKARELLAAVKDSGDDPDLTLLRLTAELGWASRQRAPQETVESLTAELAKLRDSQPKRADVRVLLAAAAEVQSRFDAAESELRRAVDDCDDPLTALLPLARLYAWQRRAAEAQQVLGGACERYGTRAAPHLALADLLVGRQQPDQARAALRRGLEQVSDAGENRRVALRLAWLDAAYGDPAAGLATLRKLAAADPRDVQARVLLLELPGPQKDAATAQRLVDEIKAAEGSAGLMWRFHQARLWLAGENPRERQGEIAELLQYCIDAEPRWTAPALRFGQFYEALGDPTRAEAVYRYEFRVTDDAEVADRLLALLQREKRFPEARELLARLERKLDEQALSARRLALAVQEGRYAEALRELELRLAGEKKDPLDLVRLAALSYLQNRDAQRALSYLDQAAALGAEAATVARTRVHILRQEQRLEEAEAVLNELVRTQPRPEAYLLRARYYLSQEQPDLAERDYIELARVAQDASGPALLGEFYAGSGRLDQAIDTWDQGLKQYPEAVPLKRGLTKALLMRWRAEDRARAESLLTQLQASLPDDADLLWVRAVARFREGTAAGADEARALLRKALGCPVAGAETYRGLAQLALQLGEAPVARDLALRGLLANPGDTELLLWRARAELAMNDLDAALALCERALAADPDYLPAYAMLALLAYQKGDIPRAEAVYRTLLQKSPQDAEVLNNLAWLLATQRAACEEALAYARQAVALRPEDPNFRDTLATALKCLGKLNDARDEWRRSAEMSPVGSSARAVALLNLARVCSELTDWSAAEPHMKELTALAADSAGPLSAEQRAELGRLLEARSQKP
jgi:tetratricopeptide (TPR) repeat protein